MEDKKCKICRRLGEKLFLKGEKCFTPKCVINKKPYAPGRSSTKRKRPGSVTEYGKQLREKQKVRNTYGVSEKQFSNYVKSAVTKKGTLPTDALYELVESRLDNVVFRTGLATSRPLARQMVSHGHITVNGRKLTVPSYTVKMKDLVSVREGSKKTVLFTDIVPKLTKHNAPKWIKSQPEKLEVEIIAKPKIDKAEMSFDLASVIEYYSR